MFESDVGFSVSFTRQCCGIGSGAVGGTPPARPRPAPAGAPAGAAPGGGGGGTNTPADTTSADITVVCAVDSVFRVSQFVGVEAARRRAATSMASSNVRLKADTTYDLVRRGWRGGLRCVLRTRRDVRGDRNQIVRRQIGDDELHELR